MPLLASAFYNANLLYNSSNQLHLTNFAFATLTSGTSCPCSISLLSSPPLDEPDFTSARNKSPELRCVSPYFATILAHCVPLPDPGPPEKSICRCSKDASTLTCFITTDFSNNGCIYSNFQINHRLTNWAYILVP